MEKESALRQEIIEVGRRLWQKGFVAANDGNITCRLDDNFVLTTPTGVSKGFMTPDMIVKVDMDGNATEGYLKPSSEIFVHLMIYKERPDVKAVLHAHPPFATAFAVAGISLEHPILPEAILHLDGVPLSPYGTPGTPELVEAIRPYIKNRNAVLLENHGAFTVGDSPIQAYYRMETLEHYAKISLLARLLGRERVLTTEEVLKLLQSRNRVSSNPICEDCGLCALGNIDMQKLVDRITRKVLEELNKDGVNRSDRG
ncbi:class II aldolase/adducin family protein [bacterium]|nr:class II aldolase/adducin family protein [bacterium]